MATVVKIIPPPRQLIDFLKKRSVEETIKFVKWLFPNVFAAQNITFFQAYIVKRIAFSEVKRLSISAYTRYGKSQMVALAILIYILINRGKRIKFLGPTGEQSGLIKDYISELLLGSRDDILLNMAEIQATGAARIKAEASQKRLTFTNGCEYRVLTAFGKGFAGMGHGGDVIVMDEAALISKPSYAKIVRMLGDDPENSILIELFNPWDRDTKAYDHSISPRFERIQIGYEIGIQEGRITQDFVDEMREDMTPLEFAVLYESRFPDEAEDSMHSLSNITQAEKMFFGLEDELQEILAKLEYCETLTQKEKYNLNQELKRYKRIISCDPADQGLDEMVMIWGTCKDNHMYEPHGIYSEPKSDPMEIVGRMINKLEEFIGFKVKGMLQIDVIGIGTGPVSRCRELKNERGYDNITVVACSNTESPMGPKNKKKDAAKHGHVNKKSQNNFRLKTLFEDGAVALGILKDDPEYHKLRKELLIMKWKFSSGGKKLIVDPDKSPDYNDALVYFIWKDKKTFVADFL